MDINGGFSTAMFDYRRLLWLFVFWIGVALLVICNDVQCFDPITATLFFGPLAMDNSDFRWPFSSGISQLINIILKSPFVANLPINFILKDLQVRSRIAGSWGCWLPSPCAGPQREVQKKTPGSVSQVVGGEHRCGGHSETCPVDIWYLYIYIPVVPHKAVAEVSKIGNL